MLEPAFWRAEEGPREAAPLTRALLSPLSWLYGWGGAWRIARATPYDPGVPVICVGNLTLGGAGKTPVVAALRARLSEGGLRAASLSRGYGGSERAIRLVHPADRASRVGDEPALLARSGESWIGRDRAAAGAAMAADGVNVIVMDDGHQNPSLKKTLSLVVIDTGDPFGNGRVFPAGPLRETVARGLARADAVVLMGDGPSPDALSGYSGPVLRAILQPLRPAPDGPLVAFAGIGRPQKVFDSLREAGAALKETLSFADHHVYTASDVAYLRALAKDNGARLITTEKDHVRLDPAFAAEVLAFPVTAVFADAEKLDALMAGVHLAR